MNGTVYSGSASGDETNSNSGGSAVATDSNEQQLEEQSTGFVKVPIVGFEVMDERARFTVFKLRIESERLGDTWLVFRRYTDFVRLHNKLKEEFPGLRIPLPPKRWLRDNFETAFLEERMKGLQAFVDSILLVHPALTQSPTVREFFCLDEPPVYPESAEETRSMFGTVDDNILHLRQQLSEKLIEIELLKAELALATNHRDLMFKTTKNCKNCSQKIPSFITLPTESTQSNNNGSLPKMGMCSSTPIRAASKQRRKCDASARYSDNSESPQSSRSNNNFSNQSSPEKNGVLDNRKITVESSAESGTDK